MRTPRDAADEELARAARAGAQKAFAELVERYQGRLFRFLRLRTASAHDAEELVQEVFLRSWRHLDRYDPRRPFGRWIFTLAVRAAVSRRRRRRLPAATERELEDLEQVSARTVGGDGGEGVWDLAARVLAPEPRSALWLFYAEQRTAREIAAILGKREVAVRVMLHRARQKLALHLQPALVSDS